MTKADFNWDRTTWTDSEFAKVKEALVNSTAKYFPDYSVPWILRTDASNTAVNAVLLQVIEVNNKEVYHPIGFKPKTFSGFSQAWDTFKKECYGLFFGVKAFSYYLLGKKFVLETDHNNLIWIEKFEALIVIRWRICMQSNYFLLRHIKGKDNTFPDWGSRMYLLFLTVEEARTKAKWSNQEIQSLSTCDCTLPGKYHIQYVVRLQ